MSAWSWSIDPLPLAPLVVLGWLYARGVGRTWRRGARRPLRSSRILAFGLGWLLLAIALASPLAGAAETLLSAHMAQHVLLMVAPLAIGLGAVRTGVLLGLEQGLRARVAREVRRLTDWLVLPRALAAAVLVGGVAVWHVPVLYQAALRNPFLHAAEHLTFIGVASLFWIALLGEGRGRRLSYGASLLTLGIVSIVGTASGAILTFSTTPWYPAHARGATELGLDWLADQQLAGLVMWLPMGMVLVGMFLRLAYLWLQEVERGVAKTEGVR